MFEIVIATDPGPNQKNALKDDLERNELKHQQELVTHEPKVREVDSVFGDPSAHPENFIAQQQDRKDITGDIGGHTCVSQFQMKVVSGLHIPSSVDVWYSRNLLEQHGGRSC
ncbi:hypothetical protein DEE50_09275 [Burkholderia cepacia]|uniref:Uncharacterized protein n=1 Tax=Burkholderia cepacia TaxID=292 RepID=A0A8I1AT75_BURCE|nr:hypothetical protein [Burkholderia cepacia]MBH9702628.1 hypothetical protein [Burkholderia cepacia]MBH9718624.1 hypothetical protein [Burkholderia cepacia]MBH9737964.1 hypothetical protein [Burkholderia cepacia]MBX3758629.1 hypothetical protein [Burkholderia cepacia]